MTHHDKEIVGLLHNQNDKSLILFSANGKNILYESVVFFHFDNFSDQNVIFDIYTYKKSNIPHEIIEAFPCLFPFLKNREIYNFHYINSSIGLEGIVITKI